VIISVRGFSEKDATLIQKLGSTFFFQVAASIQVNSFAFPALFFSGSLLRCSQQDAVTVPRQ
jgi:hypothetical protein